jgi:hypothetical protein
MFTPRPSTRVIIHRAARGALNGPQWEIWIQGYNDPFHAATLTALNVILADLKITRPVFFGAIPCDALGCPLAATGTVLWVPPRVWETARACDTHQARYAKAAEAAGFPHAILPVVADVSRAVFTRASIEDEDELARALADCDVPAEVFPPRTPAVPGDPAVQASAGEPETATAG